MNAAPIPRGGGVAVAVAFLPLPWAASCVNAPDRTGSRSRGRSTRRSSSALLARRRGRDAPRRPRRHLPAPGALAAAGPARPGAARGRGRHHGDVPATTRSARGSIVLDGPFAIGFTMLWILGMINSINFIDGLDGLSSGIALIAAVDARPDLADDGGRPAVHRRSCASRWRARSSASCAGTSTRPRSSSAPAA